MGNSTTEEFFNVSLKCLSMPTLRIVSTLLNPTKYIPTKENLPRDWKGLADLIGCNREDVSSLNCSPDPTFNVLKRWSEKERSTVKIFLLFLQQMDRYDVFDDIISLVINDINNQKANARHNVDTSIFITMKDLELQRAGLPPKQYDASILYADEDSKFASDIVTTLEQQYKLDIFMKERDLIGGTIEHDATMKVIANRSNRLIIILSPAFLESSENKYFISFAQSIGIEQRHRKIIPCIYQGCEIPYELKPLHKLDYRRSGVLYNFYEKLYSSIIPTNTIISRSSENTITPTLSIIKDTLTIPQITPTTLKGQSSMPDLSVETDMPSTKRDVDTVSQSSLPIVEQSTNKKSMFSKILNKKFFKKKPKFVAAS